MRTATSACRFQLSIACALAESFFESVGKCPLCTSSRQMERDKQTKYGMVFRSAEAAMAFGQARAKHHNAPQVSNASDDEDWSNRWAWNVKRSELYARLRQRL